MMSSMKSDTVVEPLRAFDHTDAYFGAVGASDVAQLVSNGSDIVLVLSQDGRIDDLAYRDVDFAGIGAQAWTGQHWKDIVTSESVEKVTTMLADVQAQGRTLPRQISHGRPGEGDLLVSYRLVKLAGLDALFAFGENLSDVASAQARLVQAQIEMEADYRKLRETEARYRTVYQMADRAVLVVNGATRAIMDANRSAANLFGKDIRKLVGESVSNLLDRASRKEGVQIMTEAHYQGSAKSFQSVLANDNAECRISVEPFRENGQNNLLVKFDHAGEAPRKDVAQDADDIQILKNLPEGAALIDAQGYLVSINEQFLDLVQSLNKDRIVGRHISNWLGASTVDTQVLMSKLKKEERVVSFATIARGEAGGSTDVTVSASTTDGMNKAQYVLIISEDTRRTAPITPQPYGAEAKPGGISELVGRVPMKELIRDSVDVIEKMCIEAALNQTNNNRASAADLLGLSRQSLYIKLKRYGLEDYGDD